MRCATLLLLATSIVLIARPADAMDDVWARVPHGIAVDSLEPALRRIEAAGPPSTAGAAAFALGQFHFARGEYRLAAAAFGRAAARLQGLDRIEARYRQGLAWLGERDGAHARAAFDEVAMLSQPYRALAQLGLARAYGLVGDTDQELSVLRRLLDRPAGEAEPAALALYAELSERARRPGEVRAARERLAKRWPKSFEAALLPPPGSASAP